jgi:hypothetical protein
MASAATKSSPKSGVNRLLNDISAAGVNYAAKPQDANRHALRQAALALAAELESPPEAAFRAMFSTVRPTAIMIAINAGWFDALVRSQNGTITVDELVKASKADPSLVRRVMRNLVVEGIVGEPEVDTYSCNKITPIFLSPMKDGIKQWYVQPPF